MNTLLRLATISALVAGLANPTQAQQANGPAGAGPPGEPFVFRSVFDPLQAPAEKSMGLLQSSFMDALDRAGPKLQVAWVIDGTTSMKTAWAGLRTSLPQMVGDLRRRHNTSVSFALIVYRDQGAKDGKISALLPTFESDPVKLINAVNGVRLDSGAPYFLEPVDLAVRRALELPWDDDIDTTKWIVLVGDAPPFGEGLEDPKVGAVREVSNEALIELARVKGVNIHGLLCQSDEADYPAFAEVVDRTRRFMETLSTATGGLQLDSSQDDVRAELAKRSRALPTPVGILGRITPQDVASAALRFAPQGGSRRVRVAVLPHTQDLRPGFDLQRPAGRVAVELQHKLGQLAHVEVKSPVEVERAIRAYLRREGDDQWKTVSQAIGTLLDVDFVIWGQASLDGAALTIDSGIFEGPTGLLLAKAKATVGKSPRQPGGPDGMVSLTSAMASSGYVTSSQNDLLSSFLTAMSRNKSAMTSIVAADERVQLQLLGAYRHLEDATAFAIRDPRSAELLTSAKALLQQAIESEPNHPWGQYLLANCLYNQAQLLADTPEHKELRRQHLDDMRKALNRAYQFRTRLLLPDVEGSPQLLLRLVSGQIEADHALLVDRDYAKARAAYEALLADPDASEALQRSATWMLMGIFLGDWGSDIHQPEQARSHAIALMARWPESPEAQFLTRALRWNDQQGTLYAELPLINHVAGR